MRHVAFPARPHLIYAAGAQLVGCCVPSIVFPIRKNVTRIQYIGRSAPFLPSFCRGAKMPLSLSLPAAPFLQPFRSCAKVPPVLTVPVAPFLQSFLACAKRPLSFSVLAAPLLQLFLPPPKMALALSSFAKSTKNTSGKNTKIPPMKA